MDTVFQQAPFDNKKDLKSIEEIAKEVEQKVREFGGHYDRCDRCGERYRGITNCAGAFTCVRCLLKDRVECRFKGVK